MNRVHLIGIGGSGLSAIARVLLERGFQVSGSDRTISPLAIALEDAGVKLFRSHNPANVHGADVVVRSSAVPDDNPEVVEAKLLGIPVLKRAEFLDMLLKDYFCIAIAGTHGKTTTTAMVSWILTESGKDPSFIIGGVSPDLHGNAHAGKGSCFVIEADEYDRMFLGLKPAVAVVTNVEHDHPDCFPTPEDYFQAFLQFSQGVQNEGLLVVCQDDPGAARLLVAAKRQAIRVRSYSLSDAQPIEHKNGITRFQFRGMQVAISLPGLHNVRNALAALIVADELSLPSEIVIQALSKFHGTGRRFEVIGQVGDVVIIDDYAHHPTEIRATLEAARMRYPDKRIWAVWQPHTFSRTRQLFEGFSTAFMAADVVVVTDVYAAREALPTDGFTSKSVADAIASQGPGQAFFIPARDQVQDFLLQRLSPGDVLLVLSAGDADSISAGVLSALEKAY